jgi:nucleoside-specific outer membrane channel protein Tsx
MLHNFRQRRFPLGWITIVFSLCSGSIAPAIAADWSDTAISWRYGNQFREPFNNQAISKQIVGLTHASSNQYGGNFLNIEVLKSDSKDPSSAASTSGADEIYVVYRNTLDIGKISGRDIHFGPVRGIGITGGLDLNAKNDAGYNSRKRMFVLGPTFMMNVPGFLNVSLLALWESNNPSASPGAFNPGYPGHRYYYDMHPMLNAVWATPLGSLPLSFEGYANFIASKGRDETGQQTAAETNIDMQVMYDLSAALGATKNTFRTGFEYQYWRNKFGNSNSSVSTLGGNAASTSMLRIEYHF